MIKVFHLSVECYPVAKVGGLADVVGALPKYQRALGIDAAVVMPWYDRPFVHEHDFESVYTGSFLQGETMFDFEISRESNDTLGFPLYMVKIPGKLDRKEVYCYPDESEQFIAFQHAVLQWFKEINLIPDVIHCHDHHVGLMPFLMKHSVDYSFLSDVGTVATVHNGQYQGWMDWEKAKLLPAFDTWKWGLLDWDGLINPLAALIKCSGAYTTVSEGYLAELYQHANGLEGLFRAEKKKSFGIVNGIDTDIWDPEQDVLIAENYTVKKVVSGKRKNKHAIAKKYQLDKDLPLLVFIGRFAREKGADLLPQLIVNLQLHYSEKLNIFILGSGDETVQSDLEILIRKRAANLAVFFGYDEHLAHELYAGADFLFMPSRVEPCGLNQLYAMKYGTLPVVHAVGGLKDTVLDIQDGGYGITFPQLDMETIVKAIDRALLFYTENKAFVSNQKKLMQLDFSWEKSANKYIDVYNQLM